MTHSCDLKEDSFRKRYLFKFVSNVCAVGLGVVTQMIIPRSLGPKLYGDFNFLTQFFTRFIGFLNMGSSLAFYTKISSRPRETGLIVFYARFMVLLTGVAFGLVFLARLISVQDILWPQQTFVFVLFGLGWALLTWISEVLERLMDAYALTVYSEKLKIFVRVCGVGLLSALFFLNLLNLKNVFLYYYVVLSGVIGVFLWLFLWHSRRQQQTWPVAVPGISYAREFYVYCAPLAAHTICGFIMGIADSWLLQHFGGSVQQGFFGLSLKVGALCFLFTSAMTPLLMREFSIAYERKDINKMAWMFKRYVPLLYVIASFFSAFVAVRAREFSLLFGGAAFAGAVVPLTVMSFLPVHQTYGQMSGSLFHATGRTRLYRNIGVSFMIFGIPLTYVLLADPGKGGLGLGALGLALKMVAYQFLIVNVQLYFNFKLLKMPFRPFLWHQIYSLGLLVVLSVAIKWGIGHVWGSLTLMTGILANGLVYTLVTTVFFFWKPEIFGVTADDIMRLRNQFLKKG